MYVYGAVSPLEGDLDWRLCREMNTLRMGEFLVQVSQAHPTEFMVMVVDGASSHKAKDLLIPDNIRLLALPPYAPELNPQEHIWDEVREKEFPNRVFSHLDAVVQQLEQGLPRLAADRGRLHSLTAWPWIISLNFWPKDFTFVCPTEIAAFGKINKEFQDREAQILGGSTDSEFVHHAWRTHHDDLKDLPFPMLADIKRELCGQLGILDEKAGVAQRATFIVDPENVIRFVYVTDLSVGRNPQEVLRVLDALQTDKPCPCNWQKGQETLSI